jgi:hypothetical protein
MLPVRLFKQYCQDIESKVTTPRVTFRFMAKHIDLTAL